ncbi:bifunctional metallophosphatase/5'-nucleotidase [Roseomonas frigidaquae]|uniref:Bifunctional metallophosphatase/5'-nucleotidase n=1 Tax=Falsiroseomonas frigidaquae TaxID=487318 RepID=A0ABX1F1V7_9PROT|nr:5'-nucleotidase C-terminal domain-containing protein [Falsiroseomonas frigidaquae]NKE46325.1 bifunctional metallophosphatase/5'-nucleotidase [Falsiroseomonas frigidaquae]
MASGSVTLLQLNDVHGYLEPHAEPVWHGDRMAFRRLGGYARIATLLRRLRSERPGAVVALDNGDTFHGTYPVVSSKGQALVPILNAIGLDGMTAHWDFAYGTQHLRALAAQLDYPLLAINCFEKEGGAPAFPETRVLERGGLRVGVIGIAATIVDKTMPPHFSTGVRLTLGQDELPGHIARLRLRDGADLIVVLSHLGFPQDMKLAAAVPGIDALLSGHTHNRMAQPAFVNGTPIIQSGCHGAFAGRLDLDVADGKVVRVAHELIALDDSFPEDAAVKALVDAALAPHRGMLEEVVGHTAQPLHRNTMFHTPMDALLLAAIAEAADTDLAFSNGWRYGAPVPPGPVTMNDLWNIIPPNPPVSVVELTGAELVAMLEENLERTFCPDPYGQMGGYVKRCRGLRLHAKLENPYGQRVERLFIGAAEVEPERSYRAAYVTAQGVPGKFGRDRRDLDIRAIEALRRYLATHVDAAVEAPSAVLAV